MAYTHRMQTNRRELKYIIDERRAAGVREFIGRRLVLDEFADPKFNNAYMIHSLYLDNDQLALCNATLHGLKNRFKLRIRFYDHNPEHPVFFEIKSRVNDTILKERTAVHRSSFARLVAGDHPLRSDLVKYNVKNQMALERFCLLRDKLRATGKAFVSYLREAYVSPHDDSVRVTFDSQITASAFNGTLDFTPLEPWLQPQIEGIVLELKFTDRFPHWMGDLTRMFNLERGAMAKYCHCVQSVGRYAVVHR
jgi:SPX domain protein involved in polyphosphate accumulation